MSGGLITVTFALAALLPAVAQQPSADPATPATSSAFLPAIGESRQYRYLDTLTTAKHSRNFSAALTLTSVSAKEIHATVAIDGKDPHSLDFYLDDTGTLQPTSMPGTDGNSKNRRHGRSQSEEAAAFQSFVSRISLASRIGAKSTQEASFRVKLMVPGASCPLNPTLVLKPTQPEAIIGDANDTTSVNSPANRRLFMPLGLGFGAGFIGGAIGGTPGRIVGISISATSLVIGIARHAGPQPADVSLHIDGKLADNRLQTLSGDQEVLVHANNRTHTISDKWSLAAGPALIGGL